MVGYPHPGCWRQVSSAWPASRNRRTAMTDTVTFGAMLCACRRSAGLSQEELAKRSGLSVRAIGDIERARTRVPHPGTVRRLAEALGVSGKERGEFYAAASRRLGGGGQIVPRQLPGPVRQFTGRRGELAGLTSLLRAGGGRLAGLVTSTDHGTNGDG